MSRAWSLSGAVLAGGASRRMGRDKALLDCSGEPLWRRQVNVLRGSGATPVALVRRRGQPELDEHVRQLHDTVDGAGPLAGLQAALTACPALWLAVLAVDMPKIDPAWFRWLCSFCRPGVGAVARVASGFEPLAAIYPREALATATEQVRLGRCSLQHLVIALVQARRMTALHLPASEAGRIANWNMPDERPFVSDG